MADTPNPRPGDLQGTAASIVHDVLERAESAAGVAEEKVKPVVSKMPQAAQAPIYGAVHAAAEAAASMRDTAENMIEGEGGMGGYVRANPRQAIGLAFVTGFVIGRFLI